MPPKLIETQAVVIGSGPGGYPAAIRLAQLGVDTVMVEKKDLGGVCLNVGCIPSKALISASKLVQQIREAEHMGIHVDGEVSVNLKELVAWKGTVVDTLTGGVKSLVEGNGGRIVHGHGRFVSPHELEVDGPNGLTRVTFESAIIATGSVPLEIAGFRIDGEHVVGSAGALSLEMLPKRMVVIGGGYIGMEMGGVFQRLGTEVTVVEYADSLLPGFAKDLVRPVERRFKAAGGKVLTKTRATGWEKRADGGVRVDIAKRDGGDLEPIDCDIILLTVGRKPNTAGLDPAAAGVTVGDKGFIAVDGAQRTNVAHIYAVGDVAGEPMLAHKATKEGEVAAEVIAGKAAAFDVVGVPAVVFTDPEIASVGLSEAQAKERGHKVRVGKFSFAANGRALSLNEATGFVRAVVDEDSGVLLGVEAVGPEVSNLIAEAGLALELGALAEDVGATIHAHPTLSEAVMEAANAALGHAIHAINRKRKSPKKSA